MRSSILFATGLLAAATHAWSQCQPAWSPLGTGTGIGIGALLIFDDGTGPNLYAGGGFETAGGVTAKRIARWDGQQWHTLGAGFEPWNYSGIPTSAVWSLATFDDGTGPAVYAGGSFAASGNTIVNAIARWDGLQWRPLGDGLRILFAFDLTAITTDMLVFDDGSGEALYAAGSFDHAGGQTVFNIARWNGTDWSDVGGGIAFGHLEWVADMAVHDDGSGKSLYIAGGFNSSGTTPLRNIARWNGVAWTPVGNGLELPVAALAVLDDGSKSTLYAVEEWNAQTGGFVSRLSKWDGQQWIVVDPARQGKTFTLSVLDDETGPALVAGTGAQVNPGLIKWDGSRWLPYLDGVSGPRFSGVAALLEGSIANNRSIFVGGRFNAVGPDVPVSNIAMWETCIPNCYADCDHSTGASVLDIFDFLCFQNAFVNADPYACDCDTTTGPLVCDILDFLCFQNAFVAGCP
jgi:hypothetical protein